MKYLWDINQLSMSSGTILAVYALCCVPINLLSWTARVLSKSFSSRRPIFSPNRKRKQWRREKDAVLHGVDSGLIPICCQHTFRHSVVVPQFWCGSYSLHLAFQRKVFFLFFRSSKYEFRWKIWLGFDFRVTSSCFHISAVGFVSSRRRFLICVCFKVPRPCCVNSHNDERVLLNVLYISARERN